MILLSVKFVELTYDPLIINACVVWINSFVQK